MDLSLFWIPATIVAALAQTARNVTQRGLTRAIGTVGATQVRFLYGLPFACLFLLAVSLLQGVVPPAANAGFLAFCAAGALAQVLATGLMLQAMRGQGFAVVTAYVKTEPVQVAIVAFAVLGDPLTLPTLAAIVVATAGVILLGRAQGGGTDADKARPGLSPMLMGMAAGALFAVAAVGFRGAILALPEGDFLLRATTTLVWALAMQTALLLAWLLVMDRGALMGSFRVWKPSLAAGFLGAFASQFWFIGFALTSAANVRTLALVEVLFAYVLSRRLFAQATSRAELAGLALVVGGVLVLLRVH